MLYLIIHYLLQLAARDILDAPFQESTYHNLTAPLDHWLEQGYPCDAVNIKHPLLLPGKSSHGAATVVLPLMI